MASRSSRHGRSGGGSGGPRDRPPGSLRSPIVTRVCARPLCSVPAAATLSYDYDARLVWIEDLRAEHHPMTHDLCAAHADRSRPPTGWELNDDRRPEDFYAMGAG